MDEVSASGSKLPLAFLLEILNEAGSSRAQKIRAAEMAAPYMHPRLNAVAATVSAVSSPPIPSSEPVIIFGIPRGCQIEGNKIIWPDGTLTDPPELTPYTGTPSLPALTHQRPAPEPAPFEVAEAVPPENVANLGAYRRSREEPPDESGAAWVPSPY